jgi:hypothetical protein
MESYKQYYGLQQLNKGDTTFCLRDGEHFALVNGRVYGPWPDKGAAEAGMQTEQRRAMKKAAA